MIQPTFDNGLHNVLPRHVYRTDKDSAVRVLGTEGPKCQPAGLYDSESFGTVTKRSASVCAVAKFTATDVARADLRSTNFAAAR